MTDSVHGLPPLMSEGLRVAVVPPPLKEGRWHTVVSVSTDGGSGELVALSGVRSIGAAQALVGKCLLACVDDLPSDYALHDIDALLDREVRDERRGLTGTIAEVMVGPANDVWVIDMDDPGGGGCLRYLVPVIDEVVDSVPIEGVIDLRIPDGLDPEHVGAESGAAAIEGLAE